ncbi:MAG: hypothetical protein HKN28_03650, partial [Alphaproteobacteria bacterium]|nr:hypothetical protein [Alphaproteobacteria bacterium]
MAVGASAHRRPLFHLSRDLQRAAKPAALAHPRRRVSAEIELVPVPQNTNGLTAILARRIAAEGPISVADYMGAALGHPVFGYYMGNDPFGVAGDFTTAPEISQMFGELVGLWCAEVWRLMGSPAPFNLIELGPGRGTLMQDALRAAR